MDGMRKPKVIGTCMLGIAVAASFLCTPSFVAPMFGAHSAPPLRVAQGRDDVSDTSVSCPATVFGVAFVGALIVASQKVKCSTGASSTVTARQAEGAVGEKKKRLNREEERRMKYRNPDDYVEENWEDQDWEQMLKDDRSDAKRQEMVDVAESMSEYLAPKKRLEKKPFDPKAQVGVTAPLGYFDPLNLCTDEETFRKYRIAELKHGRIAMAGSAGMIFAHYFQFFGFQDEPAGIYALIQEPFAPGQGGLLFLLWLSYQLETDWWRQYDDKEPGDFGDPAGFGIYDVDMRNKELNNGRFAMFAILGILAAELRTGKDAALQLGLPNVLPYSDWNFFG